MLGLVYLLFNVSDSLDHPVAAGSLANTFSIQIYSSMQVWHAEMSLALHHSVILLVIRLLNAH